MSRTTTPMSEALESYMRTVGVREPTVLAELREETAGMAGAGMQTSPEQGQLLHLLVKLTAARRVLEVGTFTGYSSLWMALALPDDGGTVTCCDVSAEYTAVARRYWDRAGVSARMDLRLAPALDTLAALEAERAADGAPSYDLAFIDADKENYADYYESALTLLRPGGLVAVDNVLWHGDVVDDAKDDADTRAIRAFNSLVADDDRVDHVLVPIGDGLTLARKR
ncbi:O-methyltransferase, family 3 [Caenispirillum salinarum AK4]|uniref:O-methyltransferase, family 3 n=1 Tax=Caenispirillum salinarum AK4 TaxID=1238182 RepID=K9GRT0_9PROT|nr:class I SAM-dependent methyltransferase [Caenispirillum salinarum]EKV28635.1 O-methyltransferase, family 3 [Caenispirillum salinarum AK4]